MEIKSQDGLSFVMIDYLDCTPDLAPDIKVSVRVSHHSFCGHSERVWTSRRQIDNFIDAMEKMRRGQQGKAFLNSLGFPADGLYIEIFQIPSEGGLGIKVNLHEIEYFSNELISHLKVNVGFNLPADCLPQLVEDLRAVFKATTVEETELDEIFPTNEG